MAPAGSAPAFFKALYRFTAAKRNRSPADGCKGVVLSLGAQGSTTWTRHGGQELHCGTSSAPARRLSEVQLKVCQIIHDVDAINVRIAHQSLGQLVVLRPLDQKSKMHLRLGDHLSV